MKFTPFVLVLSFLSLSPAFANSLPNADFVALNEKCQDSSNGLQSRWFNCMRLGWDQTLTSGLVSGKNLVVPKGKTLLEQLHGKDTFYFAFNQCVKHPPFLSCLATHWRSMEKSLADRLASLSVPSSSPSSFAYVSPTPERPRSYVYYVQEYRGMGIPVGSPYPAGVATEEPDGRTTYEPYSSTGSAYGGHIF